MPIDGGDRTAGVMMDASTTDVVEKLAGRTLSYPTSNPDTGVDLGAGAGAVLNSGGEDKGGAKVIDEAVVAADTI